MGLSIGNMPLLMGAARPRMKSPPKLVSSKFGTFASRNRREDIFLSEKPQTLNAGFKRGSVSSYTAAARTIDSSLKNARKVVPTPQEASDRIRARLAESRELRTKELRKRQIEGNRSNPALQTRRFIKALNETAGTIKTRMRGEQPNQENQRKHHPEQEKIHADHCSAAV